ncbi:MAG: toll/interleukin-1 receptor domain-containing protein [Acidobacteriota bacterium]
MKIFVSYASQDVRQVEPTVHALRNQGHRVFFDESDLKASGDYNRRIEEEISQCDLFVFMISPHSVAPGHYALSEVRLAARKWPRPEGRVLPVLLAPADRAEIPAYLLSVVMLKPSGNIAAEVVADAARLAGVLTKRRLARSATIAAVALLAAFVFYRLNSQDPEAPDTLPPAGADVGMTSDAGFKPLQLPDLAGSIPELVESVADGFLIGVSEPNELLRLSTAGELEASVRLQGVPRALSAGDLGLFVATHAPAELLRLDPQTLAIEERLRIDFPPDFQGAFGEPFSRRPVTLAEDGTRLWMITGYEEGEPVLAYTDPDFQSLIVPEYFNDDLSFLLRNQILEAGSGEVWSVTTRTSPSSLHRFSPGSSYEFEGQNHEIISCATDLVAYRSFLVVEACDWKLKTVFVNRGRVEERQLIGILPPVPSDDTSWESVQIVYDDDLTAAAVSLTWMPHREEPPLAVIAEVFPNAEPSVLLKRENATVKDLAGQGRTLLAILETASGVRELLELSLADG